MSHVQPVLASHTLCTDAIEKKQRARRTFSGQYSCEGFKSLALPFQSTNPSSTRFDVGGDTLNKKPRPSSNTQLSRLRQSKGVVSGATVGPQIFDLSPRRKVATTENSHRIHKCRSLTRIQNKRVMSASTYKQSLLRPIRESRTIKNSQKEKGLNLKLMHVPSNL